MKRFSLLSLGLVACLGLLIAGGCSTTSSSGTTPAPAPSGTTTIEVGSGGSATLTANTNTGACSIVVVDQNLNPITSTNNLNVQNITIQVWSTTTTSQTASVGTLTYNGGTAGSAISYAMSLDRSGSMGSANISSLEAAAKAFVANMNTGDQGAVVNFGYDVKIDQGLTSVATSLVYAIENDTVSDTTATNLHGSIYSAIDILTGGATPAAGAANARRAVISMTDGGENVYAYTQDEVIAHAKAAAIPVYTIGLGSGISATNLQTIASETGGLFYSAPTGADLLDLYNKISTALGSSWTVNFTSPVTFVTGTTYYVLITVTYEGGISDSALFTVTL